MQLQDFFDYKNQLMKDILTNKEIVSLLIDKKPEDITEDEAPLLAYKQVFPCEYVPETVVEGKTFICFDVDVQRSISSTYLKPILYIWVFAHRSKLRLPEGGVRTDKICSEICKAINGSKEYGLGELDFYSAKRFAPMTDYQGKMLTFHADEFNRFYDPHRIIPDNRKRNKQ